MTVLQLMANALAETPPQAFRLPLYANVTAGVVSDPAEEQRHGESEESREQHAGHERRDAPREAHQRHGHERQRDGDDVPRAGVRDGAPGGSPHAEAL